MNELYHHGVKGMKWGVRRKLSSAKTSGKSNRTKRKSTKKRSKVTASDKRSFINDYKQTLAGDKMASFFGYRTAKIPSKKYTKGQNAAILTLSAMKAANYMSSPQGKAAINKGKLLLHNLVVDAYAKSKGIPRR